jgi:3-hydroxyisobutyrate dehydrogenase-like beta-hydroxyacid dehydrogenase
MTAVGILSPGEMGAAIGGVLHQGKLDVVTCLQGRSELTRLRAGEAGMRDVEDVDALVQSVDVLLSVLVPAEARAIADQVAASVNRTGARPVFVECNAVAPQTVRSIEAVIRDAGSPFIDAGIIGNPPRHPNDGTRFYCSGPDTEAFESLAEYGLDVRRVGPQIGQASGLKMVYASSTKGTTALWTELFVAARALGLEQALLDEFGPDHLVSQRLRSSIPSMPKKSRRWVGEMEEIAATFAHLGLTPRVLEGAADMYRFVGETPLADQSPRDSDPPVDQILDILTQHLNREER